VRCTDEAIQGIATIKSHVWEDPFISLLMQIRGDERRKISHSQSLKSTNISIYFCGPILASLTTFGLYMATHNGNLPPISSIFYILSLLQTLRATLGRQWARAIETG